MVSAPRGLPQLASLGALASAQLAVTKDVGPQPAVVALNDGASIDIPANAFPGVTSLTVTRFTVALDRISFYAGTSFGYVVSTSSEVPSLGAPIVLQVPNPGRNLIVVEAVGGDEWHRLDVAAEDPLRVIITHFSDHTFVFTASRPGGWDAPAGMPTVRDSSLVFTAPRSGAQAEPAGIMPTTPATSEEGWVARQVMINAGNDQIQARANRWERALLGIGESGDPERACKELNDLIDAHRTDWTFTFPEGIMSSAASSLDLGAYLFGSELPADMDARQRLFYTTVLGSQARIKQAVLASATPLSPADVFRIAVEANRGNAAIGALAAHNFLKDLAYDGRNILNEQVGNSFTGDVAASEMYRDRNAEKFLEGAKNHGGELASHLQAFRSRERSDAGSYDKLGPIYHLFATMTAATLMPRISGGDIAQNGEALLRATGIYGDVRDAEKGQADACGNQIGKRIAALYGKADTTRAIAAAAGGGTGGGSRGGATTSASATTSTSAAGGRGDDPNNRYVVYEGTNATVGILIGTKKRFDEVEFAHSYSGGGPPSDTRTLEKQLLSPAGETFATFREAETWICARLTDIVFGALGSGWVAKYNGRVVYLGNTSCGK
jgi:hypothetical protein